MNRIIQRKIPLYTLSNIIKFVLFKVFLKPNYFLFCVAWTSKKKIIVFEEETTIFYQHFMFVQHTITHRIQQVSFVYEDQR